MHFFLLSIAVLVASCAAKPNHHRAGPRDIAAFQKFKDLGMQCKKDDTNFEEVKSFWHGDITSTSDMSEPIKCFFKCILELGGALDADGNLQKPPGMEDKNELSEEMLTALAGCMPSKVQECQEGAQVFVCAKSVFKDRRPQ